MRYIDRYCHDIISDLEDLVLRFLLTSLQNDQATVDDLLRRSDLQSTEIKMFEIIFKRLCPVHSSCFLSQIKIQRPSQVQDLRGRSSKPTMLAWFLADQGIRHSDLDMLSEAIKLGLDINDQDLQLLYRAVHQRNLTLCHFLVTNGSNPHFEYRMSLLRNCHLCYKDRESCRRILTPINYAIWLNHERMSELLMRSPLCHTLSQASDSIAMYGSPTILESFLKITRQIHPQTDCLIELKFLKLVFSNEDVEIMRWLINHSVNLEPLGQFLHDFPSSFDMEWHDSCTRTQCKSKEIWNDLLNAGVLPTEQLLVSYAAQAALGFSTMKICNPCWIKELNWDGKTHHNYWESA